MAPKELDSEQHQYRKKHTQWHLYGSSVRGTTHVAKGLVNQDAIKWLPQGRRGELAIMAVADGHGSAIRSDQGSKFAVTVAIRLLFNIMTREIDPTGGGISSLKSIVYSSLPKAICHNWEQEVDAHIAKNPFTTKEESFLKAKLGSTITLEKARIAYGSTLLVAAIKDFFAVYAQISDGDILVVDKGGKVSNPVRNEDQLLTNETASLCHSNNWNEFRINFQEYCDYDYLPELILLATDGYSNSFSPYESFEKIGSDYLSMIRLEGLNALKNRLRKILIDTSKTGSGDDITVGIIVKDVNEAFRHLKV